MGGTSTNKQCHVNQGHFKWLVETVMGLDKKKLTSLVATLDSKEFAAHVIALLETSEQVPSYAMEGYRTELEC